MNPLGLFLGTLGPLLTHLHTVYMADSECLPTRLNPLAERTCFSQVGFAGCDRPHAIFPTVLGSDLGSDRPSAPSEDYLVGSAAIAEACARERFEQGSAAKIVASEFRRKWRYRLC